LLISLGFPFALFFPTEPLIEREEALLKEKKSRQECKAFMRNMSKEERKARESVYLACCAYNSIQKIESDGDESDVGGSESPASEKTLTLGDFYRELKSRWDGQESVQIDRLSDFEDLDSRWRATRQQNDQEDNDSESYYDSDDGSSYGDPPGM
ncbi:hypothetical protein ACHAXR_000001, partial [Thalassiosira sp. AJA248-18]